MITPQKVIQSIDQMPVPAPTPHAANVPPTGALHTMIARAIVTKEPMITACHADIRSTGSSTRRSTMGISAMSVLPNVECAGSSDWTNEGRASASIEITPPTGKADTAHDGPI
jgi:hypothetical protein